jgi:predicted metalloendopeptidase
MSINLKDDFYTYVNYKWLNNTKLDDNKAKLTEFIILLDSHIEYYHNSISINRN